MTGHYEQVARSIGQLVDEKQQLYGDGFSAAPAILRILYPDGVKPEQYESLLTMVRVLDKLKRIAADNDSDGEDPWRDVGGYAVLEVGRRENPRGSTPATVPHDGDLDDGETDVEWDRVYKYGRAIPLSYDQVVGESEGARRKMVRDTEAHVRPYYHPAMQAASDDLARKMQEAVRRAFPEDFDATVTLGKREEYDDGS